MDLILCYIDDDYAYFTEQSLDKQWGDDWNDAPYEQNAGEPYTSDHRGNDWKVIRVGFQLDYSWHRPCDSHLNSPYSVQSINNGNVPWLRYHEGSKKPIMAGTTLREFIQRIRDEKGEVYLPLSQIKDHPEWLDIH